MKKRLIYLLITLIMPCILLFSACSPSSNLIWQDDFESGANNHTFYGDYTINSNDGTISLRKMPNVTTGPKTYFGQEITKKTPWRNGGITVSIMLRLHSNIGSGEGFNYSVSIDVNGNEIINTLCFRKTSSGLKVAYMAGASNAQLNENAMTQEDATVLVYGWHTIDFVYNTNGATTLTMRVKDINGKLIYEKADIAVTDSAITYLNYASLSYMSANFIDCEKIAIYES